MLGSGPEDFRLRNLESRGKVVPAFPCLPRELDGAWASGCGGNGVAGGVVCRVAGGAVKWSSKSIKYDYGVSGKVVDLSLSSVFNNLYSTPS